MCEFIPSTHATNASRSSGIGDSGDAVDVDAAAQLLLGRGAVAPPAREHVDLDAVGDERLGELVDVAREAARDDRRVLPREDEDARGHGCGGPGEAPRRS